VLVLLGVASLQAGPALRRPRQARIDFLDGWIRFARLRGLRAVLLPEGFRRSPGEVPEAWMARTGVVLGVRDGPLEGTRAPPPPSLSRVLYFRLFPRRGPDQIPLPGQFFLERWVQAGGAALSSFSSRERFTYVADQELPLGDVLFALAFVVGGRTRALASTAEVLHLATLRGGRRQQLGEMMRQGLSEMPWVLKPDRRPLFEVLSEDARRTGWSLVVDEPLAGTSVWAGGRSLPGAFSLAACQSLRASVTRLGEVVGMAVGRLVRPPSVLGGRGSAWSRNGFVRPRELLPAGWWAPRERRLWIQLQEAPRDQVRGVAAWVSRARRPASE
jgi:hypothetical protein